ncbi:18988_t:CDS:10 [Dentiscutata erythropus]|uniref:Glutamate--tRNA ligase, mitochondrial n=1 Tax=Dentiscutata erythropus TaxID=1348616 RepID=A0A9N9EUM7_9GLOM|nr:18988_t:CDS:10 [Dentiscutata erythropus]
MSNTLVSCKRLFQTVRPTVAVRVRFAPSPTGYLHLGGLRTALFNYLLAQKTGGVFILRIEDTDRERYVPGSVERLISILSWSGLTFDEGPGKIGSHGSYYQSERTDIYKYHVDKLIKEGNAYRCFCTPERLKQIRSLAQKAGKGIAYDRHCLYLSKRDIDQNLAQGVPYTVRLKTPDGSVTIKDLTYGNIIFNDKHIDDTILLKSDGYPTYHLANVIDDHLMGITHVLRGEEWLSSTPKHVALYKALGWNLPEFVHLPLLFNPDRTKLSKRSGDVNVEDLAKRGYLPEALINFVALLGWSSSSGKKDEIFTLDELIAEFSLEHIGRSGAIVMREKLDWLNKQHLIRKSESQDGLAELVSLLKPLAYERFGKQFNEADKKYKLGDEYLSKVIMTIKDRIQNIKDIPELCGYFFVHPDYSSPESKAVRLSIQDNDLKLVAMVALEQINILNKTEFEVDTIKSVVNNIISISQLKQNQVLMILRYIITGVKIGAGVVETMKTIGKDIILQRINRVLDLIN